MQYISCIVIWILNIKNCSKLIPKYWQHLRSIHYPKPRSKNHPWINVEWYIQLMSEDHHYYYYHYHYYLYHFFCNHHCSYHCYHDQHKIIIIFIILIKIMAIIINIITITIIIITIYNINTIIWKSVLSWWDKSKMVKLVCWI